MERAQPKWDQDGALRRGYTASRLFDKHTVVLTTELPEGLSTKLKEDLALFGVVGDGAALGKQRTTTKTKQSIAAKGHKLIGLFRNAARRSPNSNDALREAVGVGKKLSKKDAEGVLDVLGAVAENAEGLRACGATAAAITAAASIAAQLQGSKSAQQGSKQARAGTTEERVDAHLRIEAAVDAIHVAGTFVFWEQPAIAARFERLVSSSGPLAEDDEDEDEDDTDEDEDEDDVTDGPDEDPEPVPTA